MLPLVQTDNFEQSTTSVMKWHMLQNFQLNLSDWSALCKFANLEKAGETFDKQFSFEIGS